MRILAEYLIFFLLLPFSIIYFGIVLVRNKLFDFNIMKQTEFDFPVIGIGNIRVGGTGKTPVTELLISILKGKYSVATLSRGYKRKTKGFKLVFPDSDVHEVGDEPKQLKSKFNDITVAVDEKRVNGIRQLLKQNKDIQVILLDDAYQHRYVKPGLNILLLNYNALVCKDFILPSGRLREPFSQIRRANMIMITKCPSIITKKQQQRIQNRLNLTDSQKIYYSTIKYHHLEKVFSDTHHRSDYTIDHATSIIAFCGIANPKYFSEQLNVYSNDIELFIFKDHHDYQEKDIRRITRKFDELVSQNKLIVTTEKDAVKLRDISFIPQHIKPFLYYLPLSFEILQDKFEDFTSDIVNFVEKKL